MSFLTRFTRRAFPSKFLNNQANVLQTRPFAQLRAPGIFGTPQDEELEDLVPFFDALEIPEEADPEGLQRKLDMLIPYLEMRGACYLGYQTNQDLPDIDPIKRTLELHLNNAGDPFIKSYVRASTKSIERAVLRYCATLWSDEVRDDTDPNNPENFWGYVLNMGSTEGNLNALWNARTYVLNEGNEFGGYEPIVILSKDAHYSLPKAADVLRMEMSTKVDIDRYGRVDPEALLSTVRIWAQRGRSIVAVLNMGTTFTGAYDDINLPDGKNLVDEIHAIANEHQVACWVHMDGALGGFIAPFFEKAFADNPNAIEVEGYPEEEQQIPHLGFDLNIQSTNASFYKFFGAPYPCGIFMTQNKFLRPVGDVPAYIGSPDTTLGGGRNAFSGLYMWYYLNLLDLAEHKQDVIQCLRTGRYLKEQLDLIDGELGTATLNAQRSPWSFSVTFVEPAPEVFAKLDKYSIPIDVRPMADGGTEMRCHVYCMQHTYDQETGEPSRILKHMLRDLRIGFGLPVPTPLK